MNFKQDFKFKQTFFINFVNLSSKEKEIVRNWKNNKEIKKWMFNNNLITCKEHKIFLENLKDDKKNFYWLIKNKKKGKYLSVVYLNKVDFKNKNAYFGMYVNPNFLSRGFGIRIINCLKELVFDLAGWHTLKLEVIDSNKRAINFYKRAGFNQEGKLKEFVFRDKKWRDVIIMSILKEEYNKKNAKK